MEMDSLLCIHWLGNPRIELGSQPIRFEMRKSLALLAYLRLEGREISRERLATLFWPEFDQQHAFSNLRRSISSLCSSLPRSFLSISRAEISFANNERVWEDVAAFREHRSQVGQHGHPSGSLCEACLPILEKAAVTYRGDFLEGFNLPDCPDFDEWQCSQRESLRQEFADTIKRLVHHYTSIQRYEKAIPYARRWVALDRLHEPAQQSLIALYSQAGQRSAAIRQYENFARELEQELRQTPEKETIELYQAIQQDHSGAVSQGALAADKVRAVSASSKLVLKVKLYIPTPRGKIVRRDRLNRLLKQIETCPLTVLSAPAGFGKSTALADWVRQSDLPVGWISLDGDDNYLNRFLSYVIAALESIDSNLGSGLGELLNLAEPVRTQVILDSLLHNVEMSATSFVLVMDDYQSITSQPIHDAMAFLLNHLPQKMHLVISTRTDPPLPLARLRISGNLTEIRAGDLRFSAEEAKEFLNELMLLDIPHEGVLTLAERTEGWIAGLKMAALSLRGRADASQFIESFSGSNRFILDYLVEEVLKNQPAPVQAFLLVTSILDRVCAPLADALDWQQIVAELQSASPELGAFEVRYPAAPFQTSQQILEYLEKANLFTTAQDEEQVWFRYHQLLTQLLRARALQAFGTHGIARLHQRAALWFNEHDMLEESILHALAVKDYLLAAQLIGENMPKMQNMLAHGDYEVVLQWISVLPEEVIELRPMLQTFKAWILGILNRIQEMEQLLHRLEQQAKKTPECCDYEKIKPYISFLHAMAAFRDEDLERATALASQAKRQAESSDFEFVNNVMLLIGTIHLELRNAGGAARAFRAVERSLPDVRSVYALLPVFSAIVSLADIRAIQGDLRAAEAIYQRARGIAAQWGDQKFHLLGRVYIALGELWYQRNELDAAVDMIRRGIDHYQKWGHATDMAYSYAALSRALHASGDLPAARAAMQKALDEAAHPTISKRAARAIERQQVRQRMEAGDLSFAQQWQRENPCHDRPVTFNQEQDQILRARILMAYEQPQKALDLLDPLVEHVRASGRKTILIEIQALQALAYQSVGQEARAVDMMLEALQAAGPAGYARVFADEGEPARCMLEKCKSRLAGQLPPAIVEESCTSVISTIRYIESLLEAFPIPEAH